MFAFENFLALVDLFFFSGFWSTTLSVSFIVLSLIFVAYEKYTIEYFLFGAAFLGLQFFTDVQPATYIWHHPLEVLTYCGGYLAIGGVYSMIKYWSFVRRVLKEVRELKIAFIRSKDLAISPTDPIPEEHKAVWQSKLKNELKTMDGYEIVNGGISPANQKARLTNWIAFWPFSAIGLFLADPLKHSVILVRKLLSRSYELMFSRLIKRYIHLSDID